MEQNNASLLLKLHERIFTILHLKSMRGKIFMLFHLSLITIAVLTVLDFWNLSVLKTRLELSERYDDLLNNILEVRRFEKNFLIYGDNQSLIEGIEYLDKIDELVSGLSDDLEILTGKESLNIFLGTLEEYRALVTKISRGEDVEPDRLRNLGKSITNAADQLRLIKRGRIHIAIKQTSFFPFAFLCIFLPLMGFVLWLVSYGLVRPLNVITRTTEVGRPRRFQPDQLSRRRPARRGFRLDRGLQQHGKGAGNKPGRSDPGPKNRGHRDVHSRNRPMN